MSQFLLWQRQMRRPRARSDDILHGHQLLLARLAWLVLSGLGIVLFAIDLPIGFVRSLHVCTYAQCGLLYLSAQDSVDLRHMGLSVTFFAIYFLVITLIFALVCIVIGLLIFWRKSDQPHALFIAFFLIGCGTILPEDPRNTLAVIYPSWLWLATAIDFCGMSVFFFFFYLFPNGRFVPRQARPVALLGLAIVTPGTLFPNSPWNNNHWPALLAGLYWLAFIGSIILVQIYRYRRHATPAERQQTKWVLFGFLLFLPVFALLTIFSPINNVFLRLIADTAFYLTLLIIPLTIAISILRYQLWDIDVLLNRTLVYGLLTGLLALLFVGGVVGFGDLVGLFSAQHAQPVATTISVLITVALFQPLRRRIQNTIDRRFYRRKYDAEKTLAAFSASLRTDVDLEQLQQQLLAVVQETTQPTHLSLWLAQPTRKRDLTKDVFSTT